ncbi:CLUMA_CG004376, isoform A [Clunio marinus]|uniref:CLUMA_CG004376, isoform A n=1 Tax=Clunio marinus TaxID=568069 RepID=A0A1J1HRR7_9DIPT|nr:CLUMA_CG004376, isoform A [Clunio marinus]
MFVDSGHEKVPYPPAYNDIYPAVSPPESSGKAMGWQPARAGNAIVQQPTSDVTPRPTPNVAVTVPKMLHRSNIGLYPVKLQPCPHCQKECKTTTKTEATMRTHLFAFILCVSCCCFCVPLPYLTNNATKITNHFCENCKSYIGTYSRRFCCCG